MEDKDLKELASQLMCPNGEKGVEVAAMMNDTNIGMTKTAIDTLNLVPEMNVLEIGPGNAGHLTYLFEKEPHLIYTGLDISELMVEEALRLNQLLVESKKADFVLYNGTDIPFENNSFDAVYTVNTIYFWENPLKFLAEIRRVMKTGGSFALTFAEASFMEQLPFTKFVFTLYDQKQVAEMAQSVGFKVEKIEDSIETVKSKSGDLVERKYTTVLMLK